MQAAIKDAVIHMGLRAGRELMEGIGQAQHELMVLSPFLTTAQLQLLIKMHEQGVRVNLITTISEGNIGNVEGYDYRKELIRQYQQKDTRAEQKKESLRGIITFLGIALLVFVGVGILTFLYYYAYAQWIMLGLIVLTIVLLFATVSEYYSIKIYRYSYRTIFPIRVFIDPGNRKIRNASKHFIHAKLFIVDQKVAFLGSADFTCASLQHNYESIVKTEDPMAIRELLDEVKKLFNQASASLDFVDIESWGRMIYDEPKL
jgi:phosphatidylserine/phosphatidylglycerophosphate/cardiolipin synthase-like enzyme